MTRKALLGLIIVTSSVIALVHVVSQAYVFATLSVVLGVIWVVHEEIQAGKFSTVLFVALLMLAILKGTDQSLIVLVLLGVSTNLAAWDLSRFRARIADETRQEVIALLESRHLSRLALTIGAGFVVAMLPVFIQISINFVVLLLMILLLMIALRRSVLHMRGDSSR